MKKIKNRKDVPLMFRFLTESKIKRQEHVKSTKGKVDFYENPHFAFYSFYKPISKISKIK